MMLNKYSSCCLTIRKATILLLFGLLSATNSFAFEKLSEAQSWVYDRSHLANTSGGQVLIYGYSGADDGAPIENDKTTLSVMAEHDDGRRDVELEFLTGEQNLPLPPFTGFRGNPIIIAMLEHIAQSMSAQTGGGALYFRNRIRDALASSEVTISESKTTYDSEEHKATTLTFFPFKSDEYLGTHPVFKESKFTIQISDDIPGGVVGVVVSASDGDEMFERNLQLQ